VPQPTVRVVAIIVAAVLCGSLGAATVDRNRVYRSEVSYWQDAARRSPNKARTANNLGYAYALACRDAEALAQFSRAAVLDPADSRARVNRRLLQEGALFRDGERLCR
jgi:Flp pilus assembly protein TadD